MSSVNPASLSNLDPANRKGKPGTSRRRANVLIERLHELVDESWAQLLTDLEASSPRDRLAFFQKVITLLVPREQVMKMSVGADDEGKPLVNFIFAPPSAAPDKILPPAVDDECGG